MISSQECVGHQANMLPMIFCSKDRQKIQDPKKIQDADDMVRNMDTRSIAKKDTLPMTRKVRWKDLEKEEQNKDTREIDACLLKSNS